MDVGCYCLHFARNVIGSEPTMVRAVSRLHDSGVDEMTAGVLGFADGSAATFSCGTRVQADNMADICGTDGYIEIPVPWKPPLTGASFTIARSTPPKQDGASASAVPPRQTISVDATGPLYAMEADEFAAAVLDDAPPAVSRSDSLANMHLLDEIRKQIGLDFPG
jgi:predicted dehydrogenase